jgi:pimeloyl-ACP methyl ester carboxylesterase
MANKSRTETVDLHGVELKVTRKGEGPPLLLLHGGGGPMEAMPFADALAERFEIVAPVHPGFAGTPIPKHYDGMPDLVFTYLDLLDALGLRDAVVMGVSLGGWLAAELAVLPGVPFSKLVLVDAVGVKHGGPTDRDIADIFGMPAPALARLMWHDLAKAPDPVAQDEKALETMAGNRIALALYGWEPYLHNPKLPYRLHRITTPTLVLWGESDRLVTPDYGRKYAALIPGAKFVAIPEAGHSPQAEQPEAFVRAVLDFAA